MRSGRWSCRCQKHPLHFYVATFFICREIDSGGWKDVCLYHFWTMCCIFTKKRERKSHKYVKGGWVEICNDICRLLRCKPPGDFRSTSCTCFRKWHKKWLSCYYGPVERLPTWFWLLYFRFGPWLSQSLKMCLHIIYCGMTGTGMVSRSAVSLFSFHVLTY